MYASSIAAATTFGLLASSALAAPTAPAPYPPTDKYVVSNFHVTTQRMSPQSSYSMDITLNQNGRDPYTTSCSGTQVTQPVLSYLGDTACEDAGVVISWNTVEPSDELPGAHYQLNVKDSSGYVGSREWKWDVVKQDGDDEYPTYYVDTAATFEMSRQPQSQA